MRPFAAVLLALGLPALASAEVEVRQFLTEEGSYVEARAPVIPIPPKTDNGPLMGIAVIPQECVQLNGHMGCSRAGYRTCIYKDPATGKNKSKRMGNTRCTPRSSRVLPRPRIGTVVARSPIPPPDILDGTYTPSHWKSNPAFKIPKPLAARSPVPPPDVLQSKDTQGLNLANKPVVALPKPNNATVTGKGKPRPKLKHPKKKGKKVAQITAKKCTALKGRKRCFKGKQVCLYKDAKTQKTKVKRVQGTCKVRGRPGFPNRPLPRPLPKPMPGPFPNNPTQTRPLPMFPRPGGPVYKLPVQPPNQPAIARRSAETPSDDNSQQQLTRRTKMLWVTPPECKALGGFMTCLAGKRTCRYMDMQTGTPKYRPLPGSCTRRIINGRPVPRPGGDKNGNSNLKAPTGENRQPGIAARMVLPKNGTSRPYTPIWRPTGPVSEECNKLKGFTSCSAGKQTCIYRNENGKFQIKRLDTTCSWRIHNSLWRTAPIVS